MAKFKVGDRVRVRSYISMMIRGKVGLDLSVYGIGPGHFAECRGKSFTVSGVCDGIQGGISAYHLLEDEMHFFWPECALAPTEDNM